MYVALAEAIEATIVTCDRRWRRRPEAALESK
jgi:predicted nucleic acid-binding protein